MLKRVSKFDIKLVPIHGNSENPGICYVVRTFLIREFEVGALEVAKFSRRAKIFVAFFEIF